MAETIPEGGGRGSVLPPGTLLQLMYLRERLTEIPAGRFVEIGPGSGEITQMLLDLGWAGQSCELDPVTIGRLQKRFASEIREGRYSTVNVDYLKFPKPPEPVDLVISCMVMEHFDDSLESAFMRKSQEVLKDQGLMIGIVPGSPAHWGIEDDIAGHCRRYTRDTIRSLMASTGWSVRHIAGLTFPVSNFLLPVSNFLVTRNEKSKLKLTAIERTKASGRRNVSFKTHFPSLLGIFLNTHVMWPLHLLQKAFKNSESALVLYFESQPVTQAEGS